LRSTIRRYASGWPYTKKMLFSDFSASTCRRFCQGHLCADFMVKAILAALNTASK
jgi:hypothetical protein